MKNIEKKKFFRRLLRRSLSIVGVDIGAGFIKAAEISFAGKKPVLKAAGVIGVPGDIIKEGRIANIQALPTLLKKLWVDSALTCRDAITAVDARSVFAREVVFPAMSFDELKVAVKWDMGKYVPYEENSYYYDFAVIKPDSPSAGENAGECRVFLAAAPVETIDDIALALQEARLKLLAVDVEALAIAASGTWDGINVVVDIGCFHSQIIVFSGQVPALTRIISWGGQNFTELIMEEFGLGFDKAEKFKLCWDESSLKLKFDEAEFRQREARLAKEFERLNAELSGEISRIVDYFLRNRQETVKNIYLTGGGANFKNLTGDIASGLGEIPVSIRNPLNGLDISPDIDKNHLNKIAPQLTVAVGLALRGGRYNYDSD